MLVEHVFQIKDWRGRQVHLTQRTFESHAHRRPEFAEYKAEAEETINDPDIVQESDTGATFLYRFAIGRPPFSRLYLKVVIFYRQQGDSQIGTVATFYFTDALASDTPIIEHRAQWIAGQRFFLSERGDANGG